MSRAYLFALLPVLLLACEQKAPPARHHVTAERELREDDKLLYTATIWHMTVDDYAIYFTRSDIDPHAILSGRKLQDQIHELKFDGSDGKLPESVFGTFTKWNATAKQNHVEAFSKQISPGYMYSFASDGTLNGTFTEKDIARFSELLKQLPDANAERASKLEKAEKESDLFK